MRRAIQIGAVGGREDTTYRTGSAPSVTILRQVRWGSEDAIACTFSMTLGDATIS